MHCTMKKRKSRLQPASAGHERPQGQLTSIMDLRLPPERRSSARIMTKRIFHVFAKSTTQQPTPLAASPATVRSTGGTCFYARVAASRAVCLAKPRQRCSCPLRCGRNGLFASPSLARAGPSVSGSRTCRKRIAYRCVTLTLVERHDDALAGRAALAGRHEAVADFADFVRERIEREVREAAAAPPPDTDA